MYKRQGLTFTGSTASQGVYDPVTGKFDVGSLASGATATLTLSGTVDVGEGGYTITNITTAANGDQVDPSTVGDDLEESIVVNDVLNPSIGLAKDVIEVFNHEDHFDVTFRLVFENTGNVDLTNLEIFDDIASQFGPAFIDINAVVIENFVGTGTAPTVNPAWAGDSTPVSYTHLTLPTILLV